MWENNPLPVDEKMTISSTSKEWVFRVLEEIVLLNQGWHTVEKSLKHSFWTRRWSAKLTKVPKLAKVVKLHSK